MGKKLKFTIYATTGFVGSKCTETVEVDESEWNAMDDEAREAYMREVYEHSSMVEWGWYPGEEDQ